MVISFIINEAQKHQGDSLKDIANEALEVSPFRFRVRNSDCIESDEHPYELFYPDNKLLSHFAIFLDEGFVKRKKDKIKTFA